MYLKNYATPKENLSKGSSEFSALPISKRLKKHLRKAGIDNTGLVNRLKETVYIKKDEIYTNKQVARIVKAINDDNQRYFKKINYQDKLEQAIIFDKERFNEKPGNYLIISRGISSSTGYSSFLGTNLTKKLDHAFVLMYYTDNKHQRNITFLRLAALSGYETDDYDEATEDFFDDSQDIDLNDDTKYFFEGSDPSITKQMEQADIDEVWDTYISLERFTE